MNFIHIIKISSSIPVKICVKYCLKLLHLYETFEPDIIQFARVCVYKLFF